MADLPLVNPSPGLEEPAPGAALALRRTPLFEAARAAGGRLVPFADTHDLVDAAYYLVWPKGRVVSLPLQRLIDWIGARGVTAAERSAT